VSLQAVLFSQRLAIGCWVGSTFSKVDKVDKVEQDALPIAIPK